MEAAITSTVNHPNVVATFSYDIQPLTAHSSVTQGGMMVSPEFQEQMASDWKLFIVQEYCNSGSLRQALDKRHFWDDVRRQPKLVRGGGGVGIRRQGMVEGKCVAYTRLDMITFVLCCWCLAVVRGEAL